MRKRVPDYEIEGLKILIDIVDKLNSHEEVKIIQTKLLAVLDDPKIYECCPDDVIDKIFVGPSGGDWADAKHGGAYGAIKPVFKVIKDLMFRDEPKCPEFDGPENL